MALALRTLGPGCRRIFAGTREVLDVVAHRRHLHRKLRERWLCSGVKSASHPQHQPGESLIERILGGGPLRFQGRLRHLDDIELFPEGLLEEYHGFTLTDLVRTTNRNHGVARGGTGE